MNKESSQPTAPGPGRGPDKNSKKFLVFYVVTLFLAAAVLILLSYLVQARNANQSLTATNQEHQGTIQTTLEKMEQAQEENAALALENTDLKQQLQEVTRDRNLNQQRLETRNRELDRAEAELAAQQTALSRLWWLEHCWQRGDRAGCEAVLAAMEESGDGARLPQENPLDPEEESPRARYESIKEKFD